jgi:membrane-bound lytic murein transglycosylase MltF
VSTVKPPSDVQEVTPIIIDLGKEKKRRIKDLKRGRGRLMADVGVVVNEVRANLGADADNKQIVPIVMIYKKKRRRKRRKGSLYPLLC